MEIGEIKFREIDLFDFTSFVGLDFFLIFWPTMYLYDYIPLFRHQVFSVYAYVTNDLILQFIISILFTISMAHPEALRKKAEDLTRQDRQVNQEINEPDDLLAVENVISEVIRPPLPPGMKTHQNI